MSVLIFLIPLTLLVSLVWLGVFLWSLRGKQYEDLQGSASRILFEDDRSTKSYISSKEKSKEDSSDT